MANTKPSLMFNDTNPLTVLSESFSNSHLNPLQIERLHNALQHWFWHHPQHHFLHPCIVDGQATLICLKDLAALNPQAFSELHSISLAYGILVKQDTRQNTSDYTGSNRRQNGTVMLVFCLGLLASSRAVLANELSVTGNLTSPVEHSSKQVVHLSSAVRIPTAQQVSEQMLHMQASLVSAPDTQHQIQSFLTQLYQPSPSDPEFVLQDLALVAEYYARYPVAVELIQALDAHKIQLQYRSGIWQTEGFGNPFKIERIVVSFDTRLGAQFLSGSDCNSNPACAIAPADALLHELLHAKLMLEDQPNLIASNSAQLVDADHENQVIQMENELYRSMNAVDGSARPIRARHSGILTQVECALCRVPGFTLQAWQTSVAP